MGFRKRKNRFSKNKEPRSRDDPNQQQKSYTAIEQDNERFTEYYKGQGILDENEWETFYETLKQPLPTTFRITGSRSRASELRDTIEREYIPSLQNLEVEGETIEPPKPIPWYPDNFGYTFSPTRFKLRKARAIPELSKFHQFIVAETEVGNLSRQEAVSMIPPLLLDVKAHHWVLDMCAAPGSKTAQIIEAVHANDKLNEVPTGLVIANDADYKRSQMLVHQMRRLQSPCLMVTNHDGTLFPRLQIKPNGQETPSIVKFDRVLCDVPCSGDGTLRKNLAIWRDWTVNNGLGLHITQIKILLRGVQLLKIGGRIVYSTCSLNPIENEAVIAEVLRRCKGSLELIDVSNELPQLKRRPGLRHWRVMARDNKWINSLDDLENPKLRRKYAASLFPPADSEDLHLERSLRIYPHDQDTGGFFIAVFKKTGPITSAEKSSAEGGLPLADQLKDVEEEEEAMLHEGEGETEENTEGETPIVADTEGSTVEVDEGQEGQEDVKVPAKRSSMSEDKEAKRVKSEKDGEEKLKKEESKVHRSALKEEPFVFLESDHEDIVSSKEFFGFASNFPMDQLLVRSESQKNKIIYFVSKAVKDILQGPESSRLRVVNSGLKLFVRHEYGGAACPYRIHSDSVHFAAPFVSDKRKVDITFQDLGLILQETIPKIDRFDAKTKPKMESMGVGCSIVICDPSKEPEAQSHLREPVYLPVWRANTAYTLLLNKEERRSLNLRLFGTADIEQPSQQKEKVKEEIESEEGKADTTENEKIEA
ncbi:uncharacterized protein VTP21DRAFT_5252 [Calcarisporiella thermophila]|uniref:uncharacterized protein n=1 Tax=Calcarisporiella thermophila TaxID=911321 RepID=UPI0037421663